MVLGMNNNSGSFMIATGLLHCSVGVLIPKIRDPLFRTIIDFGRVDPSNGSIEERYARGCAFWFEFAGILMIVQGCLMRNFLYHTYPKLKELPEWYGWALITKASIGAFMIPKSGFWIVLAQGIRIVYRNRRSLSSTSSSSHRKDK